MVDYGFIGIVEYLKNIGIFEFYLPFVILFCILYGLLEKSKIFGERGRRINAIVSLAAAFFIMAYTPAGITLTEFFSTFFTQTAVILVTILSFILIVYLIIPSGYKVGDFSKVAKYVVIFAILIAIGMFISSGGLSIFPGLQESLSVGIPGTDISPQTIFIIIVIAITILIIYWMTRGEGGGEKGKERGPSYTV